MPRDPSANKPSKPDEARTIAEMIGEFLREAAVLVLVFALLDSLVTHGGLSWRWTWGTIAISLTTLTAGIGVERMRVRRRVLQ